MAVRPGPDMQVFLAEGGRPIRLDSHSHVIRFSQRDSALNLTRFHTNSVGFPRAMAKSWQRW